jgi:Exo-beta-D-glucosaminidase Ig-fold domain
VLTNRGRTAALAVKITILDSEETRVLPVYYDDNYVALLPGESRRLQVLCPAAAARCAKLALRGWNAQPLEVALTPAPP